MLKRTLIVLTLILTLAVAIPPLQSVSGMLMTEAEMAMMNNPLGNTEGKRGNAFVRVLKAPFKAIGRLFGRGRKDDNKLHRLSEKDVEKFESSAVTRIVDAQSAATALGASATTPTTENLADAVDARKSLALEHLERGRQLLHSGNVNDAIGALSLATSLDPKLKEAYNLLGVAYGTKGIRNLALGSFETALEGDDDNPEHLNNLGYFLYQIGEYEDATKYLKKAVKKNPTHERFWNNLGLVQAQRGKFDDASKSFVKAMGEFDGRLNLAVRLERLGHEKEAIKNLEKARKLRPNSQETLSRLITLYERIGQDEEAMEMRISLVGLKATAKAPAE
jgi:Tfp pilus assembly protein PilF